MTGEFVKHHEISDRSMDQRSQVWGTLSYHIMYRDVTFNVWYRIVMDRRRTPATELWFRVLSIQILPLDQIPRRV